MKRISALLFLISSWAYAQSVNGTGFISPGYFTLNTLQNAVTLTVTAPLTVSTASNSIYIGLDQGANLTLTGSNTIAQLNGGVFLVDGTKYPLTATGIRSAITDAQNFGGDASIAGGAMVIVSKAFALDGTTINVGTTGGADNVTGKPITLFLDFYGTMTTSAIVGFEIASRCNIIGLDERQTRITSTNTSTLSSVIEVTGPSESGRIENLRLDGANVGLKFKAGTAGNTDTPAWIVQNIQIEGSIGDGMALQGAADRFLVDHVIINGVGGDGIHFGVMNGITSGATNEQATFRNIQIVSTGARGIHIETDGTLTASAQIVNTVFEQIQIQAVTTDGFYCKMLSPSGLVLRDFMFSAAPTGGNNLYSAIRFDGTYGGISGVSIENVTGAGTAHWREIFKFSGSGAYGSQNRIRNYPQNGFDTSCFALDANSGVSVDSIPGVNLPSNITTIVGGDAEVITASVSSTVTLSSGTATNACSVTLTPGTWLPVASVNYQPNNSTVWQYSQTAISSTSATLPGASAGNENDQTELGSIATAFTTCTRQIVGQPITVTSNTIYYIVVKAGFTTSTMLVPSGFMQFIRKK